MRPDSHKPWFQQDAYGQTLAGSVAAAIASSADERDVELVRASIMAYAYERDKYTGLDLTGAPGGAGSELLGLLHNGSNGSNGVNGSAIMDNRSIPWINKLKSVVDVLTDKVLQGLPTLTVRAANAKFEDRRMNDVRSQALNATMMDPDAQQALYMWTRDALIKRIGFVCCEYIHGRLRLKRFHPWQVFYDSRDAADGELSQIHTVQLIDRDEWLSWYRQAQASNDKGKATPIPQHAKRIRDIEDMDSAVGFFPTGQRFNTAWLGAQRWLGNGDHTALLGDQVRIVWSYKRAWRAGEPTGRVVCTVLGNGREGSVIALDMPFARSTLPVVHWSPWQADTGISGLSIAEAMIGAQLATDRTLFKMQRLQDKYGHHKWIVHEDAQVGDETIKALLSSGIDIIRVKGIEAPPQLVQPNVLNPSDVSWLNFLLDRPASEQGITPGLTQGQSQLGANASGVARVEEVFRSLDRQQGVRDAHTRSYRRLGSEVLNAIQDALVIDKGFAARWPTKIAGQFRERPWSELVLSNGEFWLDVAERGVLGNEPAGKITKALELHAQGLLNNDSLREILFSVPDLDAAGAREIAPRRAIEAQLSALLDPKATDDEIAEVQPTEDMDLADAKFMATTMINTAIAQDASTETLLRLRGYLLAINLTQQAMVAASAPPPTAGLPPLDAGLPAPPM